MASLGVIVIHDVLVWKEQVNPPRALFKSMDAVPVLVKEYGPIALYRGHVDGHDVQHKESAAQLDSSIFENARFETHPWIRLLNGKDSPDILPVICILEAWSVDDWALTRMKVANGEWQDVNYRFSPTRFVNRIWW